MKHKNSNRFLAIVLTSMVTLSSSVFAVDRFKANNADALNLATSWDTAPGASDVGVWNSTVLGANTVNLGANLSWGGLRIDNPGGDVTIGGANSLTLGASGLDIGSTRNLTYNSSGTIALNGALSGSTTLTISNNATKNWTTGMPSTSFTGTLVLRGGTGASGAFSNNWLAFGNPTFSQTGSFNLDTGASLTNRGDFIITDAFGDGVSKPKLSLTSLTGYGDFRSDWGGTGNRTISANQSTNTGFQGRIIQNNNSTRSIHLEKLGSGTLTLTGENNYQNTIVGGGKLQIGDGGTTGNIGVGTVSVGTGSTLEFNRSDLLDYKASARMRNVSGAGDIVLDGGVKFFNYTGGALDFASAGTWNLFAGNLIIKGGSEFQTIRNGATAMGTGNVVLGDVSSSGKLSQIEGNWTWTNNIQLVGSANEIANNSTGAPRYNKLQGVISGSGNVTFKDTTGAMNSGDTGFILTGANTLNGTLTVDTFVRVGGVAGNDVSTAGGASGSLGAASVVINSGKRLTFSRTDSHAVANSISGDGAVHVGSTGITGTGSQVLTLSGTNIYAGATSVNTGRLNLTGSLTSAITVQPGAVISGTGSTTGLLTMESGSQVGLAGGATTSSFTANGATFNGPTTVIFDTSPVPSTVYDVFTYGSGTLTDAFNLSVAWRGTLTDDVGNQKYTFTAGAAGVRTWNTTDGGWEQGVDTNFAEGDTLFYGGDTVFFNEPAAASQVDLYGVLVPASVTVNNSTNPYTFDGPGSLSGAMVLTKTGTGTLTIYNSNTYTGGTTLTQGQLNINSASAIGATASTLTIAGASTLDNTSGGAITLSTNNAQNWNADFTFVGTNNLNLGTGAVTLGADRLVTVSGGNLTVGGAIGGSFSLTKAGVGILTLTGNNTYGATIINEGTLKRGGNTNLATTGIAIASGAVFEWAPTASNVTFAGALTGTGKVLRSPGAANAWFTGDNSTFAGTWEVTGGYVGLVSDSSVGVSTVGMTLNGGGIFFTSTGQSLASTRTITLGASGGYLNGSTANTNTFAAKFTGVGNLNKVSGERAILTNTGNDFTGNIDITGGGTLEIGGDGQFAAGSYGGTIAIAAANTFAVNTTANQTLSGVISGGGRLTKGNSGILALSVAETYTGTTTINGGTLVLGTGASLYSTGGFFGGTGVTNLFVNSGGTLETRDWQYAPAAALNEMRNNSYAIRINGGAVRFTENTSALRGFQVGASGATLEASTGVTYTKLAGAVIDDNVIQGVTGGSITLTGDGNGVIQDGIGSYGTWAVDAGIIKQGSGTWSLTGANTYTGDTVVNGGTLIVNGTSIADTNKLVINGGKVEPTGTETVDTLFFGAAQQASGTWGSTSSSATHKDNTHFSGTGMVLVTTGGGSDFDTWIGSFTFAPGADISSTGDPDGDGLTNQEEYAFGLKPNDGSSVNPIKVQLNKTAGTFTYTRRDDALQVPTPLTYKVWTSTDLSGWTEDTSAIQDDSAGPVVDGVEPVVVTLSATIPLTAPKLFVRVTAE